MLKTRFTELVGCAVPISQAGMGWLANPRLAAAVADAGGLGMVSVYGWYGGPPAVIAETLDRLREQTSGVFGANFIMRHVDPSLARESVAVAAARSKVVDFFYTDPDPSLVEIVHSAGALACWQVGSRQEAVAAVDAGCDFIIAQGIEAGGHVRGQISLMALLSQVLDAVDVPVLAAGGIGTGRAMAAAMAAGADGVRVGTRFVAAEEAEAHPDYVKALIAAEAQDTVCTEAFSIGWLGQTAPHRCLRSCVEAAQAFQGEFVGEEQNVLTGERFPIRRFAAFPIHKTATGAIEAMPHWAGESVDAVKRVQPAADIVHELADDAEKRLRRWSL
jgi:nitronate monooxygenase